jgi:hypothetical protein
MRENRENAHEEAWFMDRFSAEREIEGDVEMDAPPLVRFDERRMHVRAYNYWASLLGDRALPSIDDLHPEDIEDFGSHSVLLDFTGGVEDPAIAYLGSALMRECGAEGTLTRISEVPPRTLLSRLTDHYLQIIANEAPIGFEAEFTNQRCSEILYRGILMPFSSNGDTIDFVYGVINWKEVASTAVTDEIHAAVSALMQTQAPAVTEAPVWADGPSHSTSTYPLNSYEGAEDDEDEDEQAPALDEFGQTFADAREAAAQALTAEGRSRQALYRAISLAHCFALVARKRPEEFATLAADTGITVQPRSPMTALVKLIFGTDYDKTRLSEFATAIEHGLEQNVAPGGLGDHISAYEGGLKAYVREARATKREASGQAPRDRTVDARVRLTAAPSVAIESIATDEAGFAVVVMRRNTAGQLEAVGGLAADDKRAGQILQAVAKHN